MRAYLKILTLLLLFSSCKTKNIRANQESILNNNSHIEDSIHHQIDKLPRLCEEGDYEKQFIDIGDCRLYTEIEGEGTPMVLINGGPGGTHHYLHPWFSQAAKFNQVIYYDQRGTGQSDFKPGKTGYSFEQAVDDLDKLRQELGIEKWIVCGYSYGGAIAQFYTATHPEHVKGVILISAAPVLKDDALNGTRQGDYISEEEGQKINEVNKLYSTGKITLQQLLYNKSINGDWKRQNFYRPTKEEFIRASLYEWVNDRGFNGIMSASLTKYDLENVFNACPIPTMICEGEYDLTWTSEKKEILRKNHPNAEFHLFEHSGHNIYYDEPDLFFSTLHHFVKELKPAKDSEIKKWKEQTHKILCL